MTRTRIGWTTLALAVMAGCSTSSASFSGTLPPSSDGFACATQQFNALGYAVEAGDRTTGFIRASRQTSTLGFRYEHLLTVAVFERPNEAASMRIIAARREFVAAGSPEGRPMAPTDETQRHARRILDQCGVVERGGWAIPHRTVDLVLT